MLDDIVPAPKKPRLQQESNMAFTLEEEKILKLIAAEAIARMKLNKANLAMGTEIRAEFSIIDQRIRKEYEPVITPLESDLKTAQDALRVETD